MSEGEAGAAGGGKDGGKWRKALLKKLRSAVGVKARIDGGDTASLQKTQVSKGQRKAIREILGSLKEAGLARDAAEVEAAFEAGTKGGKSHTLHPESTHRSQYPIL
jgi:hypothetical protein